MGSSAPPRLPLAHPSAPSPLKPTLKRLSVMVHAPRQTHGATSRPLPHRRPASFSLGHPRGAQSASSSRKPCAAAEWPAPCEAQLQGQPTQSCGLNLILHSLPLVGGHFCVSPPRGYRDKTPEELALIKGTDVLRCPCGGRRSIRSLHSTRAAAEARLLQLGFALPSRILRPATAPPQLSLM